MPSCALAGTTGLFSLWPQNEYTSSLQGRNNANNTIECIGGGGSGAISQTLTYGSGGGGAATFNANSVTWTSSGSGDPTNIKAAVIHDDTADNKDCLGFIDLTPDGTTPISLLSCNITINWNASGIFTSTV